MSLVVIANPQSGSVDESVERDISQTLEDRGVAYEFTTITPDEGGRELALRAIQSGARHIVASGGDGTVMSVLNGILESGEDVLFSVAPGGTANLIAASLGIPFEPDRALDVALGGNEQRIDLGRCEGRYFALGIGIGIAEKLVSETDDEVKEKVGRVAYAWAALKEIGTEPVRYCLTPSEGDPLQTDAVAIAVVNVGKAGDWLEFAPDAKLDDALLDAVILHRLEGLDALRLGAKALTKDTVDETLTRMQWRSVRIEGERPMPVQIDGETTDLRTPVTVEAVPRAIRITVPLEG